MMIGNNLQLIDFLNGGKEDSTAVHDPESAVSLTYGQLRYAVTRASEVLSTAGVKVGDAVVFMSTNSAALLVALLAVIKCGAVAVPINPEAQAEEVSYYLNDCEAVLLLASEHISNDVIQSCEKTASVKTGRLSAASLTLSLGPVAAITTHDRAAKFAEDVCLMIYTSGTTSRPKGVPLTVGNVVASVEAFADCFQLTSSDVTIVPMPLFHVHGLVGATFSTLHTGGTIVYQPRFSASKFWSQVKEYKVTWYTASPTIHRILLKRKADGEIAVGQLRFVRSSSASLGADTLNELEESFGTVVLEAYGMTEAANQASCNPLPPRARKVGSIGVPTGVEIRIVDKSGNEAIAGRSGEVLVRGRSMMHGYHNKPEANLTAFSDDWFRTGDEGYLDEDGYLFLVGRIKELISRGGEKFAPAEVEEVLLRHPGVDEAACFGVPDEKYGEEVHAAIVAKEGASIDTDELAAFCAKHLNAIKIPKKFFLIESIPRTPTNKIQRQQLVQMLS